MAKPTTPRPPGGKTGAKREASRSGALKAGAAADIPVVAIGASAGGLEPIGRLLAATPPDSGLAFVVIQHLDPSSKSMLPELLARRTVMKVQPAIDGIDLAPNQVYVIPPGVNLSIASGKLRLTSRPAGGALQFPINMFLNSLAAACGARGVGVILSGSGSDGAEGLRALKQAGGLTLVQDPSEAQQNGMPTQAIQVADPDGVLPVQDMPAAIARYVTHNYVKTRRPGPKAMALSAADQPTLGAIVELLKSATAQDFGRYKTGTLQRRIERRMAMHGVHGWPDYLAMLRASPTETETLAKDLLINVTRFFRDADVFAAMAGQVADLLRGHASDQPARIWVAGCSTGEEAYSLGILFSEQIAKSRKHIGLQIFATDIDDDALQIARAGIYPESIQSDVGPERLRTFFSHADGRFKVTKELRDAVIFSRHDVLSDSPFSRLDLLSCRNLLIYLTPEAQSHVLSLAHFGLREGGLLLLGSAESPAAAPGLFEPVDETLRIYRRSDAKRSARVRFSTFVRSQSLGAPGEIMPLATAKSLSLAELVQRTMLEVYAPAAVVTNRQFVPLYYFGAADRYLKIVAGEPNQDLLSIAREGLRPKLRDTVARAFRAKRLVSAPGVRFEGYGTRAATVTIEAQRIVDDHETLVLVSFIDDAPVAATARAPVGQSEDNPEIVRLRQQLVETRRELNRTIHDLRATNDALNTKNEEAMSLNEEFLSTNEELESSKEELQSLNEELTTVNNQLRQTLEQQQQSSMDLENLLYSSAVATIMLDADLRIKVFNPRMQALFSLIEADVGRPLADLAPKFADPQLPDDATAVRLTGTPSEREIRAESGAWYVRSVLPYRTEGGEIQGAVVTFADVSRLKQVELEAIAARRYAETVVDTIREPLAALDSDDRVVSVNAAFCAAFVLEPGSVTGRALGDFGRPMLVDPKLMGLMARLKAQPEATDHVELEAEQADGGRRFWRVTARGFRVSLSDPPLILLALEDITDERRIVQKQLQMLIDAMPGAFLAVDKERSIRFANKQLELLFGYSVDELVGQKIDMLVPLEVRDRHAVLQAEYFENSVRRPMGLGGDISGLTKDGRKVPLDIGLSPITTADGFLIMAVIHDLRSLRTGEAWLRDARQEAERANLAKSRFLAAASHDLRQPLQTISLLHGYLEKRLAEPGDAVTIVKLNAAVARMAELLDTLLDINQIESGAIHPEIREIPIGGLLAQMADDFAPLAAEKGLELRLVPSSAIVRSDHRLLARMIGNLLSNAIKYTDQGRILLGCRRRAGTLRIEVLDTGVGIPVANREQIFEEFYRIDRTDGDKLGLGLGLSIVQRFAQLLGHKVEVESEPEKGAGFAIVISDPVFPSAAQRAKPRLSQADGGPPSVLLVEDDSAQLDALQALLEFEGYRVTAMRRSDEALARLRADPPLRPDFVVADYNLPGGLNGLELIREVRKASGAALPAMIVSGDRRRELLSAFDQADVLFIAKPVMATKLLAGAAAMAKTTKPDWRGKGPVAVRSPVERPAGDDAAIAVIDDEPSVRDATRLMLESGGHGVATYPSAEAFFADPGHGRYRCLVVDLDLPLMTGLELQRRLKADKVATPIVFITGRGDLSMAVQAMRDGAADFLQKPVAGAALNESVSEALRKGHDVTRSVTTDADVAARIATLTAREREVMDRVVTGMLNKNIAVDPGISQRTAEHHRQNVMRKMGAASLAKLMLMVGSLEHGD